MSDNHHQFQGPREPQPHTQSVDHLVNSAGYVITKGSSILRNMSASSSVYSNLSFPRVLSPTNPSTTTTSSFLSNGARNVFMKLGKRNNDILEYGDYYYRADGSCGHKSHSALTGRWNAANGAKEAPLPLTHRAKQIVSQPVEFRKLKQAIRNRGAVTGMSLRQLVPFMLGERWDQEDDNHHEDGDNRSTSTDRSTSTASTVFYDPHEQEKVFLEDLKDINESLSETKTTCTSSTASLEDSASNSSSRSSSNRSSPETIPAEEEDMMTQEENVCDCTPSSVDFHPLATEDESQ